MNCVEFNQKIKKFINNQMDTDEVEAFLAHRGQCKECNEELEILFLVEKTLVDIDNDSNVSYNFDNMLKEFISENEHRVYKKLRFQTNKNIIRISSLITTILMIIYFCINNI